MLYFYMKTNYFFLLEFEESWILELFIIKLTSWMNLWPQFWIPFLFPTSIWTIFAQRLQFLLQEFLIFTDRLSWDKFWPFDSSNLPNICIIIISKLQEGSGSAFSQQQSVSFLLHHIFSSVCSLIIFVNKQESSISSLRISVILEFIFLYIFSLIIIVIISFLVYCILSCQFGFFCLVYFFPYSPDTLVSSTLLSQHFGVSTFALKNLF